MKSYFLTLLSILFTAFFLFLGGAELVSAASECGTGLLNPLDGCDMTVLDLLVRLLQMTLGAVSVLALVMLVYGGLVMLTSGGNPDRVKKAKDTLLWAILGLAVILFSGAIVRYIFDNFQF